MVALSRYTSVLGQGWAEVRGLPQTQVSDKSDGSATSEVRYGAGAGAYDGVGNVRAYSVLDRACRASGAPALGASSEPRGSLPSMVAMS